MHVDNGRKWTYYWFMLRTDTLQITSEILSLIARIDEFKGAWRGLATLAAQSPGGPAARGDH